MKVRNIRLDGRRTSIRLEVPLWEAVDEICAAEGLSLSGLCSKVAAARPGPNFTSALRVWIVDYYRVKAAA